MKYDLSILFQMGNLLLIDWLLYYFSHFQLIISKINNTKQKGYSDFFYYNINDNTQNFKGKS